MNDEQGQPIYAELMDGDRYHSGHGLIFNGYRSRADVEAAIDYDRGSGWDRVLIEVQHLSFQPRVKWCSNHGSGFGCDLEGDWHSHWHPCKHNALAPACCYTVAIPVYGMSA